jgi:hypothetical protein
MWLPANLCHDTFVLELAVEVAGTDRPHVLLSNGAARRHPSGRRWEVRFPESFTSLSPLLFLRPADEVRSARASTLAGGRQLEVLCATVAEEGAGPDVTAADVAAWLCYYAARYGPWAHAGQFVAVVWDHPRGMEYDGATTASEQAIEHEVFHSWFGRGVKPATASDGWIDEAMASWATASRRSPAARFTDEELGLDEPPTLLYPAHPWSRHTPREAYSAGPRLLSGVARLMGGAAQLRAALAGWYKDHAGGLATTAELAEHLGRWCGKDLGPWWDRYVYGRGD